MLPASRFSVENRFQTKPVIVHAEPRPAVMVAESLIEAQGVAQPVPRQPGGRQFVFAAWLLGACGVLVVGGVGYRRSLPRIARGAVETNAEVDESVASVARQLVFNARTAQSGPWSDARTWDSGRKPQAADFAQVRAGHVVRWVLRYFLWLDRPTRGSVS